MHWLNIDEKWIFQCLASLGVDFPMLLLALALQPLLLFLIARRPPSCLVVPTKPALDAVLLLSDSSLSPLAKKLSIAVFAVLLLF